MKKVMAAILSLALALSLAACGGQSGTRQDGEENEENVQMETGENAANEENAEIMENAGNDRLITGGWSVNSGDLSLEANPDAKAAFEKAVDGLLGYTYEPLAVLGSQVVAGMNYRILCRGTAVVPDAVPTYEIVTVYADLNGGAKITDTAVLPGLPEIPAGEMLAGGWMMNAGDPSLEANPDVRTALDKALEGLVGANYEGVAYLADQVVAGMNYLIFCRTTPVVPDPVPSFTVVRVYADLEGNAELTDVTDVNISDL